MVKFIALLLLCCGLLLYATPGHITAPITHVLLKGTVNPGIAGTDSLCYSGIIPVTVGLFDYTNFLTMGELTDPLSDSTDWSDPSQPLGPLGMPFYCSYYDTIQGANTDNDGGNPRTIDLTPLFKTLVATGNPNGLPFGIVFTTNQGVGKLNLLANPEDKGVSYSQLLGIEITDSNGTQLFKYNKADTSSLTTRVQYCDEESQMTNSANRTFAIGGHSGSRIPGTDYDSLKEDRCSAFYHTGLAEYLGYNNAFNRVEKQVIAAHAGISLSATPNPFSGSTRINYSLDHASSVNLAVYDIQGRMVQRLESGSQASGIHSLNFSAAKMPAGLYVLKLTAGGKSIHKNVMILP